MSDEWLKCPNCEQITIELPLKRSGCTNCSYNSLWEDWAEQRIEQLEAELKDVTSDAIKLDEERSKAVAAVNQAQDEIDSQDKKISALKAERLALAELVLHLNRSLSRPLMGEEIIDVSKARSIVEQSNQ